MVDLPVMRITAKISAKKASTFFPKRQRATQQLHILTSTAWANESHNRARGHVEGRLQWTHEGVCVCEEYTHTDRHRHTQTDTQTHEMQASHILEHKGVWAGRVSEADTAELNLGNPVCHLVATGDANLGRTVHQLEDAHTRAHGLSRASTVSREQGGGMDGTTARFVQRQWQSREWRGGGNRGNTSGKGAAVSRETRGDASCCCHDRPS